MLHIIANPFHHGPLIGRAQSLKKMLSPTALANLEKYSVMWRRYRIRELFPFSSVQEDSLEAEILAVSKRPIAQFIQSVLWALNGDHRGSSGDISLLENAESRDAFIAHVRARDASALPVAYSVIRDPQELRADFLKVVTDVGTVFIEKLWPQVSDLISADIQARKETYEFSGVGSLLSSLPSASRVNDDCVQLKRTMTDSINLSHTQLLLIPSVFTWPHLQVKTETGHVPVVQFPIREFYQTSGNNSAAEDVELRLAALSDHVRFEICRVLVRSPATTTHLAERLGIAAPHISRHLRILYEAGLVGRIHSGKYVLYDFNSSAVIDLGPELLSEFLR